MEGSKASQRKTRRSDGPISTPLECFRGGKDSVSIRNSLAELAMRLMSAEDREEFRKADGVTAIVDHLARILEEQATMNYAWKASEVFGSTWEEYEVHDSLQFTLVALCHVSIDSDIAAELHELSIVETLFQTLSVLPTQLSDYVPIVLECCRNLCSSDCDYNNLPIDFIQSMWEILLSGKQTSLYWQELTAEVLANIAAIEPSRAAATPERLSTTLSLFFEVVSNPDKANFGVALSDLLCNLCCDQACCLLLICELDAARPRGHLRHSGVVYLAELTEKTQDDALKQSMEALVHNLSWSDPAVYRLQATGQDFNSKIEFITKTMLATASSFPVRNGKGCGTGRLVSQHEFMGRDRIGSIHGIASPNIHVSVRAAALAAHQARKFRQKRAPTLYTIPDEGMSLDNEAQVRDASPVPSLQNNGGYPNKRKMNLHLSLDKLEKPVLPMMMVLQQEEAKTDCGPRRKSVLFADGAIGDDPFALNKPDFTDTDAQSAPIGRSRRASSITLSMNSPEAAEFNEVAHDGPEELGKRTKRIKKLGKGAGGTVFLSLYLPTLKLVAVKEVVVYQEVDRHMVKRELHALHDNLSPIDEDIPQNQADTMKHHFLAGLRSRNALCPYLVTFYGAFLKPAKCAVSVVMEFMDMGSAQDLLDANITVSEDVLRHAAFCCIAALDHMHSQRMVHRDIKPANILMNRNGEFKVADFGLAGTLAKSNSFFSDFTGTMMYMAPERISGAQYTCVSDIWSLGITLFSLATGAYPFTVDDGFFGLEEAICQDSLPPMQNRFSPVCRDFIKRMLNRDPERRLTSNEALIHPFISGYGNSAAFRKFPKTWQSMELKRAIDPEDARTIANLAVEYSYRYPTMVTLPSEVTGIEPVAEVSPSSQGSPAKNSLFHRFTKLLKQEPAHHEVSTRSTFERLADDCGMSTEYLQKLFREALN